MVEPIPFYGLFDDAEPESYLREQISIQQRRIDELMGQAYSLQEALTKAQIQIDALSVPGLWEHRDSAWEMVRLEDGNFMMKPIAGEKL